MLKFNLCNLFVAQLHLFAPVPDKAYSKHLFIGKSNRISSLSMYIGLHQMSKGVWIHSPISMLCESLKRKVHAWQGKVPGSTSGAACDVKGSCLARAAVSLLSGDSSDVHGPIFRFSGSESGPAPW